MVQVIVRQCGRKITFGLELGLAITLTLTKWGGAAQPRLAPILN